MSTEKTPEVYAKMVEVMKSVGHIKKTGINRQQGFKYHTKDDVYMFVQNSFAEHGIS